MIDLAPSESFLDDKPNEECGVFGVFSPGESAAIPTYYGLFALQHRGQEAAGISASDGVRVHTHKAPGLVNQVFYDSSIFEHLPGEFAIGHNRYSTSGSKKGTENIQPFPCMTQDGQIAVAHNGNLVNTEKLRRELREEGESLSDDASDSEMIARILARRWHEGPEVAVAEVMRRAKGAYSIVVLTPEMVVGFRDPIGNRPLTAGRRKGGHMVASETCAFVPVEGTPEKEIDPGEMVIIDRSGIRYHQVVPAVRKALCLFEFIYFARPDSAMYGKSIYSARYRMGQRLWQADKIQADVVVPVPDSGVPAALGYAKESGIPFVEGMLKSRYINRTFIQPDQEKRMDSVRMKLSPLRENIEGKSIVLVDDSIVRGTTTGQIVRMLRDYGAAQVHVRITAPPIKYPCYYGIDMAKQTELVSWTHTLEELTKHIGADSLAFLSIEDAVGAVETEENRFCLACFNGEYPIQKLPEDDNDPTASAGDLGGMATIDMLQPSLGF